MAIEDLEKNSEETSRLIYPPAERKLDNPNLTETNLKKNSELNERQRKELEIIRSYLDEKDFPLMKKEEEGLWFPSSRATSLYYAREAGITPLSHLITYIDKGLELGRNLVEVDTGILPGGLETAREIFGVDTENLKYGEVHSFTWGAGSVSARGRRRYSDPIPINILGLPENSDYQIVGKVTEVLPMHGNEAGKYRFRISIVKNENEHSEARTGAE